jgi:hypothetical protein
MREFSLVAFVAVVCTVRVDAPLAGVVAARLMLSELTVPRMTGSGENVATAPAGKPVTVSWTLPFNAPMGCTTIA